MTEPNMLLLDEPTNDLDIDTLNVLEDFLDGWPGTLVVVSHDRYFLERVTDSVWALLGDGQISMLPGGVDEYLRRRAADLAAAAVDLAAATDSAPVDRARAGSAEERAARKTLARLDKQLERVTEQEAALNAAILGAGQDYERLARLSAELQALAAQRDELESEWLEAAEALE
jgi:ATP-binding cassette subfamily F protein uup